MKGAAQPRSSIAATLRRFGLGLCALLALALPAQATQPFHPYFGIGRADVKVTRGPDGTVAYSDNPATGPTIYAGQVQPGGGLMLLMGLPLSRFAAVEAINIARPITPNG